MRDMGFLSALKRSAGKSGKKSPTKTMPRGVRHDENMDPTPLKPLKLSLTPVSRRPSPDVVGESIDALGSFTSAHAVRKQMALLDIAPSFAWSTLPSRRPSEELPALSTTLSTQYHLLLLLPVKALCLPRSSVATYLSN